MNCPHTSGRSSSWVITSEESTWYRPGLPCIGGEFRTPCTSSYPEKRTHPSCAGELLRGSRLDQESCIDESLPGVRLPGIGRSRRYPDSRDPLAFDDSNWHTPCSRFVSPRCGWGFEMARRDSGERPGVVGRRGSPLGSLLSADESPLGR